MLKAHGVIAAAAAALAATTATASAHESTTCPHPGTVNGVDVLIACGHAKGAFRFGANKLKLADGQCVKTSLNFGLNFGAAVAGPTTKPPPDSFQLIAGPHGGSATLQIARNGKQYIGETMKLKLNGERTSGSLSGTVTLASGNTKVAVSGTFTC